MSALEFSAPETGSSVHMDLFDSFPSSTAVSSSPSLVAGTTDEQILNEDLNQNVGISSSAIGLLGHDIGCDFRQHSSSSERSSVSASPGVNFAFNQYNLQTATAPSVTGSMTKHAGASSSPSVPSSDAESPHHSRASSKSNANASQQSASAFENRTESNTLLDRIMSPSSPLGDFRGYEATSETGRNSETEDGLWTDGLGGMNCQYCRRPYRQVSSPGRVDRREYGQELRRRQYRKFLFSRDCCTACIRSARIVSWQCWKDAPRRRLKTNWTLSWNRRTRSRLSRRQAWFAARFASRYVYMSTFNSIR